MPIQSRGPNHILVLERSAVPVNDIADMVCSRQEIALIIKKFPVIEEEIFECLDAWVDTRDASENDYIKFDVEFANGDLDVMTMGISDWMYLSLVVQGRVYFPTESNLEKLFMLGMEQVITDCLMDIRDGNTNYEMNELHRIVWDEFERTYGPVSEEKSAELLLSLGVNYKETWQ
tara:strand:- start:8520 stop:9044 length:525 start_codon:yes stop_codon:yes gene_type:complete